MNEQESRALANKALSKAGEAIVRLDSHEKICGERMAEIRNAVTGFEDKIELLHERLNNAIKDRNATLLKIAGSAIGFLLLICGALAVKALEWG